MSEGLQFITISTTFAGALLFWERWVVRCLAEEKQHLSLSRQFQLIQLIAARLMPQFDDLTKRTDGSLLSRVVFCLGKVGCPVFRRRASAVVTVPAVSADTTAAWLMSPTILQKELMVVSYPG